MARFAPALQDAYVVREYLGGKNICFFGVFDGHGQDGAKVSNQLVSNLPFYLTKSKSFEVRPRLHVCTCVDSKCDIQCV